MKNFFIILSSIFLLSIIICNDNNIEELEKEENKDESENNEIENDNYEHDEQNEEEDDNKNLKGIYMTQKSFDEKLEKIFEEKGIKQKKKITKEKLKIIFEEIYKDELNPNDIDNENEMNPEEAQKFLHSVFNELTKSYDDDDKIKIKEIRNMISLKQAQDAMFTIYINMAGEMGFL